MSVAAISCGRKFRKDKVGRFSGVLLLSLLVNTWQSTPCRAETVRRGTVWVDEDLGSSDEPRGFGGRFLGFGQENKGVYFHRKSAIAADQGGVESSLQRFDLEAPDGQNFGLPMMWIDDDHGFGYTGCLNGNLIGRNLRVFFPREDGPGRDPFGSYTRGFFFTPTGFFKVPLSVRGATGDVAGFDSRILGCDPLGRFAIIHSRYPLRSEDIQPDANNPFGDPGNFFYSPCE